MKHAKRLYYWVHGAGKTKIGKKLARLLSLKFIDLDIFISNKTQLTVPEIMDTYGETHFRMLERTYLLEVSQMRNTLVSTGGGTPCFFDNMQVMLANGVSVYLKMDKETLVSRLLQSGDTRPLIRGMNSDELCDFIDGHLAKRIPFYSQSTLTWEARDFDSKGLGELVNAIESI